MLKRISKSKYYKTFFNKQKGNSKQSWDTVNSLINVKIKSQTNYISKYKQPNRN